jgi:hypothetical protein
MNQKQPVLLCIPRVLDTVSTTTLLPLFQKLGSVLWVRCRHGHHDTGYKSVYISLCWGDGSAALLARARIDAGMDFKVMNGDGDAMFPWFWKVVAKKDN